MKAILEKKLQQVSEQNLLDIENFKNAGRKAIGFYCLYSPVELAVAAGAIPLPLCGTRNDPIDTAETVLPRNLCPLIKSSYGFAAADTCPFFRFSDLIVGDTTCDGKKKMFELLSQYRPVHVMQLPQDPEPASAKDFWLEEVKLLKKVVESNTGVEITEKKLSEAVKLMNRERSAKKRLMDLARRKPSPMSGMDILNIMFRVGFLADKEKGIALLEEIVAEVGNNASGDPGFTEKTPRILLAGVPVGMGSEKVVKILEASGANVVCFENCSGYKQAFEVDEDDSPIQALARRYLDIPCSVMSPNKGRFELLKNMIADFSVDGVVDLTWQACHTYNIESFRIADFVKEQFGLPFLHLETDYADADTEQLRVRIEAFLEMIG